MNKPAWLAIAESYIGTQEFKGIRHNPIIVGFWKLIRRGGIKDDETAWCAAFLGGCLELAGIVSSRFESAISYLSWGVALDKPLLGCVAVISRLGGNHVFFVVGISKDGREIVGLGGNQSDKVRYSRFSTDPKILRGYRWPAGVPLGEPLPIVNLELFLNESKMD
jgi:uncharacterized protein (TIGR02594 family)